MRQIAVANHKGGVGKTTLTACLAAALVEREKRVLVIDLDQQEAPRPGSETSERQRAKISRVPSSRAPD